MMAMTVMVKALDIGTNPEKHVALIEHFEKKTKEKYIQIAVP